MQDEQCPQLTAQLRLARARVTINADNSSHELIDTFILSNSLFEHSSRLSDLRRLELSRSRHQRVSATEEWKNH